MKFKDKKERLKVNETMVSLLKPLENHLDENTKECVEMTLRILNDTEIEGEENETD